MVRLWCSNRHGRNVRRIRILIVMAALVLTACSGGKVAERIIEGQEGVGNVEISEDDGTVEWRSSPRTVMHRS